MFPLNLFAIDHPLHHNLHFPYIFLRPNHLLKIPFKSLDPHIPQPFMLEQLSATPPLPRVHGQSPPHKVLGLLTYELPLAPIKKLQAGVTPGRRPPLLPLLRITDTLHTAIVRQVAGQEGVGDDGGTPRVHLEAIVLVVDDLRRHVLVAADHATYRILPTAMHGLSEICQFYFLDRTGGGATLCDQDVVQLYVSVNDLVIVQMLQGSQDLPHYFSYIQLL